MMSLHKLSAGSGYRYLLRSTAHADTDTPTPDGGTPTPDGVTGYYTTSGTPPGEWTGAGLPGLADGNGIPDGLPVDETTLGRLFGHGADPVTGQPLGRGLPRPRADGAPRRVSGFDLTFTTPKSVSVLWALADQPTRDTVLAAHHATVERVLAWVESEVLATRTGHAGAVPMRTRGAVAARFDHWDSRAGDPNLHSHLIIANRVQGEDGVWRAVDARPLHAAAVTASEIYDTLLADELTRRLGVAWENRTRPGERRPAHEIVGIPDRVLARFSRRAADIAPALDAALAEFTSSRGRPPTPVEVTRLRQRATLATRPPKTVHSLDDLRRRWQAEAADLGVPGTPLVGRGPVGVRADDVDPAHVDKLAARVVASVQAGASTWTRWNLHAETARATRGLRMADQDQRMLLIDHVLDAAMDSCLPVGPSDAAPHPGHAWRQRWTSPAVLEAENTLLDATQAPGPAIAAPFARAVIDLAGQDPAERPPLGSVLRGLPHLSRHQGSAVLRLLTDAASVSVLVGPAGSGKTTALRALTLAWQARAGDGAVIGLAPSAGAAATLQESLQIPCENTSKWVFESTGEGAHRRAHTLRQAQASPTLSSREAQARVVREQARWTIPTGGLVIVDEASLADTFTLAELASQARAAKARLLLVGDPAQHDAVGTGGGFGLLTRHTRHTELAALHRFTHRWEAHATRRLRSGDTAVIDTYRKHGRLHAAPTGTPPHDEHDTLLDQATEAWADATARGRSTLLLAEDTRTVAELNMRARAHRQASGHVATGGIELRDGTTASPGDLIRTRRNSRQLPDGTGGWVGCTKDAGQVLSS